MTYKKADILLEESLSNPMCFLLLALESFLIIGHMGNR